MRFGTSRIVFAVSVMAVAFAALADERPVQDAVALALNGTLNADHIGPDQAAQAERLIKENATLANKLVIDALSKPYNKGRVEDLFVANVLRLTKDSDKAKATEVLEKFSALLDLAEDETQWRNDRNRLPWGKIQPRASGRIGNLSSHRSRLIGWLHLPASEATLRMRVLVPSRISTFHLKRRCKYTINARSLDLLIRHRRCIRRRPVLVLIALDLSSP